MTNKVKNNYTWSAEYFNLLGLGLHTDTSSSRCRAMWAGGGGELDGALL